MREAPGHPLSLPPGSQLDGKYEILGLLGVGGMGEVYKVRHLHLNALRCVKVMKRELAADEGFRARFVREARLATKVHHPNIAVVHDFAVSNDGASYLVTEFIDGITLRQWAATNGRFPVGFAVDVVLQVLAGLHEIHKQGLVHRDISAENIMIYFDDERWIAKIIDLGIAKALEAPMSERTQAGLFVGNPRYSSPEQLGDLAEGETLDCRADIYSLGVVLYEMLLGAPPFTSKTPQGYILGHLQKAPRRFSEALPGAQWPDGFEDVVFKALAKNRNQRYASAREFARALRGFVSVTSRTEERALADVIGTFTPTPPPLTIRDEPMQPSDAAAASTTALTMSLKLTEPAVDRDADADSLWAAAESEETVEAWQRFIDRFADSPRAIFARLNRDEIKAYDVAIAIDSVDEWERFLTLFPGARRRGDALRRRAEALECDAAEAFEQLELLPSPEACNAFLARFAETRFANRAEELREELLEARTAIDGESVELLETFLDKWPDSRMRDEVHDALETARATAAAASAFSEAADSGSPARLRHFLAEWPESANAAAATERLRQLEEEAFQHFVDVQDFSAIDDFLEAFGEGRHAAEARRLAAHWRDEADAALSWEFIVGSESPEALSDFAERFRGTSAARRALQRVHELQTLGRIAAAEESDDAATLRAILTDEVTDLVVDAANAALQRVDAREARRRAERDWDAAWRDGSERAFREYLQRHPDSAHHEEAQMAIREAATFEVAIREDALPLLKAFLHDFPEGRHFAEAKIRAARLREREQQPRATETKPATPLEKVREVFRWPR